MVEGVRLQASWSVNIHIPNLHGLSNSPHLALYTSEVNEGGLFMSHFDRE